MVNRVARSSSGGNPAIFHFVVAAIITIVMVVPPFLAQVLSPREAMLCAVYCFAAGFASLTIAGRD